ncbi:MAG: adenine phosphoribosyltransferase [Candidatus Gorgyraea atricola]|nr:adenine phosphoribosyltransferase [Candidatus Gorgyraea atricola]
MESLKSFIRDIPDFPKKGILFRDITTLLGNKEKFREVIDILYERYKDKKIDSVVAIDSRGFLFGSALAYKLGSALTVIRKKGKLPYKTLSATYSLEYGEDTLEIHEDALEPGSKVLLIDDLLATGGTISAAIDLVKKLKGEIAEIVFVIELSALNGRAKLGDIPVYSMVKY